MALSSPRPAGSILSILVLALTVDAVVAAAPAIPVSPQISGIFEGNAVLRRHDVRFDLESREGGEIRVTMVSGNWRLREQISEGKLSPEQLLKDYATRLEEEKPYAEIRAALKDSLNAVSRINGVNLVDLRASSPSQEDELAMAEFRVGLKRYEAGQFTRALPYFQRASAQGYPRALRTLGYMHENGEGVVRDLEEARDWYGKAAREGEPEAFYNLGRMASAEKDYASALEYYQKSIEIKPDLSMAYNNIGFLLNELRHHEEAIPFLKRATELNPDYPGSYSNLGISYDNIDRHEEAVDVYRQALELNPKAADVRVNLGVTLMHQERNDEAIQEFHKAIHLKPYWHQPYNGLGNIYLNRDEHDLAITAYQMLVKNRPNHPWGFKLLARSYAEKGDYEKASEVAAEALKLAKGQPELDEGFTREIEDEFREYQARSESTVTVSSEG